MVKRVTIKRKTSLPTENMLKRRARTRVAPFRNRAEFEEVYNWLFGEEQTESDRKKALEKLQAWKIRRGAETSASILSTLAILEAQLRDEEQPGM